MENGDRRRDVRARITLPTYLVRRGANEPVEMLDASYRGLFLRIPDPPQLRELVKLRIAIAKNCELELHAVVVRVVGDARGSMGVGLRFFALNGPERAEWEGFITNVVRTRARAA